MAEGFRPGKVGSSTMPHKRNPNIPCYLSGFGRMARSLVVDALTSMETSSERDLRALKIEPYCIENICCLADAALDTAIELITDLEVHEDAIKRNLRLSGGLIFAEAVMMRLSKEFGRMEAHEMVYHLAQKSISEGKSFQSLLLNDSVVSKVLSPDQLNEIMDPANYIGLSEYFTDKLTQKNDHGEENGNKKN
jgi:adenylosuccinate lyase